jgi:hypothetical protein
MSDLGKLFLFVGALFILGGLALILLGKAHIPLGKLPGDITYRSKHTTVYFPLASCIVISVVLTLVLYLIGRFRH